MHDAPCPDLHQEEHIEFPRRQRRARRQAELELLDSSTDMREFVQSKPLHYRVVEPDRSLIAPEQC
jgi:hypothetical protein